MSAKAFCTKLYRLNIDVIILNNFYRVNIETYDQLVSMGFPKGASAQALRQSNNDIAMSLKVIKATFRYFRLSNIFSEKSKCIELQM